MKNYAMALAAAYLSTIAWAAQPDLRNAQVITEAAQPNLQQKVDAVRQAGGTAWIGYTVQTISSHRNFFNGCGDVHYLEDDSRNRGNENSSAQQASAAILMRTEGREITKIEVVSTECHLDGGGMTVHWLTGVNGDESVKLLSGLASGVTTKKLGDGMLVAMAIHAGPAATQALAQMARSSHDEHQKEQAAFWLGVERGHDGFVVLQGLVKDSDADFRKKLTFDFSQNPDPGAVDELIRMAKTDDAPEVRGQAIFWLAQKAGKKQASKITDMAASDADTGVKKKAVFALTQLPQDESYQQLVKVAETNRDPAVRKDAIFWLGQCKDPRALEYLEKLVKK